MFHLVIQLQLSHSVIFRLLFFLPLILQYSICLTKVLLSSDVFKFSLFRLAFMSFKFTPKNDEITDISTSNIAVFNLSPPQYVSYYFTGFVLFFQNIYNISYFRVIIFPRLISKRCTTIIYIPRTKCFQYFFTRCFCSICIQKEFTKRNSVYPI